MIKEEAIQVVKDKWGLLSYGGGILKLYEDGQKIPQGILDYELNVNPHKPKGVFIVCGTEVAKVINEVKRGVG